MNSLPNPCPIKTIEKYANDAIPSNNDSNHYIDALNKETNIPKNVIMSIFQLFQYYCPKNYIDIGCAIISLLLVPNDGIFVDLKSGEVIIDSNYKNFKCLNDARDMSNNLKQIIADIFLPMEHD